MKQKPNINRKTITKDELIFEDVKIKESNQEPNDNLTALSIIIGGLIIAIVIILSMK